jgi:hypothetical protein
MGQGLCSGLRDVHNLAWRLAAVLRRGAGRKLLHEYVQERRQHVEMMLEASSRVRMQSERVMQKIAAGAVVRPEEHLYGQTAAKLLSDMALSGPGVDASDPWVGCLFPRVRVLSAPGQSPTWTTDGGGATFTAWMNHPTPWVEQLRAVLEEAAGPCVCRIGQIHHPACITEEHTVHAAARLRALFADSGSDCIVVVRPDWYIVARIPILGRTHAELADVVNKFVRLHTFTA